MTHIHIISKANPGPKVDPVLRCVVCRKSTRNKPYKKCSQSHLDGGRICLSCFEKVPDKKNLNCHLWASNSCGTCSWCSKVAYPTYTCCICSKPTCTSCLTRSTFDLLVNKGHNYPVCIKCLPSDAIGSQSDINSDSYCLICLDHHSTGINGSLFCPYDGSATPPLVKTLRGTRLPTITPSPSVQRLCPSVTSLQRRERLALENLENVSSRSGSYCPSGPVGSENFFQFKAGSKIGSSTSIALSTGPVIHDSYNCNPPVTPPPASYISTNSRRYIPSDNGVEKFQKKPSTRSVDKKHALTIPVPKGDVNQKFKSIEGTASNLQLFNFMASISTQLKSMSDEVCSLKKSHSSDTSPDSGISGDTQTCKGIQWSLKDQQFAKKTIPLSQAEVIAEQQAMISDLTKSLSSLVGSLDKKFGSASPKPNSSDTNKKVGKKQNKKNSKK